MYSAGRRQPQGPGKTSEGWLWWHYLLFALGGVVVIALLVGFGVYIHNTRQGDIQDPGQAGDIKDPGQAGDVQGQGQAGDIKGQGSDQQNTDPDKNFNVQSVNETNKSAAGSSGQSKKDVSKPSQGPPIRVQGQGPPIGVQGQRPPIGVQGQGPSVGFQGQGPNVGIQGQGPRVGIHDRPSVGVQGQRNPSFTDDNDAMSSQHGTCL